MRILVFPHDLEIGGSQLNAIEIAATIQKAGHETVVFGRPGRLVERIEQLDLEFVAAPEPSFRPDLRIARAIRAEIRRRGITIAHGYEWPPALECLLATRRTPAAPVATVMSMAVAPFLPRYLPTFVGTRQIEEHERSVGRSDVRLLEPPIDTEENAPGLDVGQADFRRRWRISPETTMVAVVSRLARELKLEGILTAIRVLGELAVDRDVSLVITGDGPARDEVRAAASAVNERRGRQVVVITGQIDDPRPVYAAADISIGMGGSALRALAFGLPLVVQGELGYFTALTADSLDEFLWAGWYGIGPGAAAGDVRLREALVPLLDDPTRRAELGRFGRAVVEERFSLQVAAEQQLVMYEQAAAAIRRRVTRDDVIAAAGFARYFTAAQAARLRRRSVSDDFNALPSTPRTVTGEAT